LHCGKYLVKKDDTKKRITIWDIGGNGVTGNIVKKNTVDNPHDISQIDDYVVICPQCTQVQTVNNGALPLSCECCGYFFQMGIDKVVRKDSVNKKIVNITNQDADLKDSGNQAGDVVNKSPVNKKRASTTTEMRLVVRNIPGHMPETINPSGDVLGKSGTVLRDLNISQQITIFRAPTGWYINAISGEAMVNGTVINNQTERRLEHGNIITIDKYMIFVEIV